MITAKIKRLYCNLTSAERKVAGYVIEAPHEITRLTVHQLAEKCDVAASAVIRFCKSIELRGFSELKIELAKELGSQKEEQKRTLPDVEHESGTEAVVRKVFSAGMHTLQDTLDMLDFSKIRQMSEVLVRAKHIFLFGIGTSSTVVTKPFRRVWHISVWLTHWRCFSQPIIMTVLLTILNQEIIFWKEFVIRITETKCRYRKVPAFFCLKLPVFLICSIDKNLVSFVICIIMMVVATVVAKWCSKDQYIRNIYTYGLAFSNFGFMGNAVVSAVFPDIFLEYLIFTMPLWTMIYMWGVPCLLIPSEEGKQTIRTRLKSFANPMFAALVIGLIIGLCGIKLPSFLTTVIGVTGDCMSPIAMMLTGITVANMDLKKVLSIKSIYVVSIIRLLVFPLIFIGLFQLIPMSQNIVVCTICSLAMPLGLSTLVIPGGYGKDTSVAAGMAIVSHLLSAVTIPFIFYVMMNLF